MNITGIITEYNPLHLGHILHITKSKESTNCDGIICIMSGNFVQRGFPAIVNKWDRAKMALDAGVDLVLELPTLYAVSSAEHFAFGAVSTLNSINVVDSLCFGSEEGDIFLINHIAKILSEEPLEFKTLLKKELALGLPFPKARAKALNIYLSKYNDLTISEDNLLSFLNSSNNILGIEYCKSLFRLKSNIVPITIKRQGSNYNDTNLNETSFQSATAIREFLYNNDLVSTKEFLPKSSYNILKSQSEFSDINSVFKFIKYKIISEPTSLKIISEATEGLDNKILKEILNSNTLFELIENCKSKRYTYTRISRLLCNIFLDITTSYDSLKKQPPNYIRVLGLSKTGSAILKEIKKNSDINIITKVPPKIDDPLLALDIKATNLYSLLKTDMKLKSDYLISPIIK